MRALESFEPAEVPVTAAAARKRKRKSTTKKLFAAAPDVLLQAIASGAAERVNFYGRGVLNSSNIEASMQQYHDEWPVREWARPAERLKWCGRRIPICLSCISHSVGPFLMVPTMPTAMRPSIFGSAKILRANFGSFTSISSIAELL